MTGAKSSLAVGWAVNGPDQPVRSQADRPVPAEPVTVQPPGHPLHALTTFELREYRRQLEHALADTVIGSAPVAAQLRETLAGVLAEQESRARVHQANGASR